ncbi:MAG: AI-2E family transporter [Hyphomicrobium sp.]
MGTSDTEKLRSVGIAIIAIGVVIAGLVLGSSYLIPLAIAVLLWNLLEALIDGFARIGVGRVRLPRWFAGVLSIATVCLVLYLVAIILLAQGDAIANAWPRYEERLKSIIADFAQWLGPEYSTKVREVLSKIDVARRAAGVFVSAQSFIFNAVLVVLYVGFLLAERGYVSEKIAAMFPDGAQARETDRMLSAISGGIRSYIWIKTLISIVTGVLSYAVLRGLGVDFAETWALLIFVLNYIPNVGSVIGVIFPSLLALVQFDSLAPFFSIAVGLTAIQLIIGNFVEPMLMGRSLNMSPFAIILLLAFWGAIWGVVGMFLSVPIMMLMMIICANVPSWRWVAILLSKDGRIDTQPS